MRFITSKQNKQTTKEQADKQINKQTNKQAVRRKLCGNSFDDFLHIAISVKNIT